jgi:hypothetical protein
LTKSDVRVFPAEAEKRLPRFVNFPLRQASFDLSGESKESIGNTIRQRVQW